MPPGIYKRLDREEQQRRIKYAVDLRKEGMQYKDIASALGVSPTYIQRRVNEELYPCDKEKKIYGTASDKELNRYARQLTQLRIASGITQVDLALKMGVPHQHISKIENGEHIPKIPTLERVAEALDLELRIDFVPKK
jgi:ribosome-binding protein aMBF1 (putative translation factor)